jgi:nicotinate-nucleotide adenylyltransferase
MPAIATSSVFLKLSKPLGLFGGTFDPVHVGHLRLAEESISHLGLSGVRWIPAGQPPHRGQPQVTAQQRLDMVLRATANNPMFSVDAGEVAASAPSYTVHTLHRLRRERGENQSLVLLVGADAFAGLPTWHCWQEIFALAHVAVSHRPGFPVEKNSLPQALAKEFGERRLASPAELQNASAGGIVTFAMTQLAISATQIRLLLSNGKSARYLLPDSVLDYITDHQLYKST